VRQEQLCLAADRSRARCDLHEECNPARHIPGFNFTFGGVLMIQLRAPLVDDVVESINSLLALEGLANRELEQLCLH
jgi:hypothetical protein